MPPTCWKWPAVLRHFCSPTLLLLETGKRVYLIFPRHYFASDSDWKSLLTLVEDENPNAVRSGSMFTQLPPGENRLRWWLIRMATWVAIFGLIVLLWSYLSP